jgi:hypothetical protein
LRFPEFAQRIIRVDEEFLRLPCAHYSKKEPDKSI